LAVTVVSEVKTNISPANMKLKHEEELDKSFIFASDIFVITSLNTAIAKKKNLAQTQRIR
jgi:hypothetical protein